MYGGIVELFSCSGIDQSGNYGESVLKISLDIGSQVRPCLHNILWKSCGGYGFESCISIISIDIVYNSWFIYAKPVHAYILTCSTNFSHVGTPWQSKNLGTSCQ